MQGECRLGLVTGRQEPRQQQIGYHGIAHGERGLAGADPLSQPRGDPVPGLDAHHASAALCFLGVGSASYGAFYEALNLAGLQSLPVIFLVSVYDLSAPEAPLGPQVAGDLVSKARAFGLRAEVVDGRDVEAVAAAVRAAREAGGPALIEARL